MMQLHAICCVITEYYCLLKVRCRISFISREHLLFSEVLSFDRGQIQHTAFILYSVVLSVFPAIGMPSMFFSHLLMELLRAVKKEVLEI